MDEIVDYRIDDEIVDYSYDEIVDYYFPEVAELDFANPVRICCYSRNSKIWPLWNGFALVRTAGPEESVSSEPGLITKNSIWSA